MEFEAGLLKRKPAEIEHPPHLSLKVSHHILMLHAQHIAGDDVVPVVHQPHIVEVVLGNIFLVVAEHLSFCEQLLEAREAAGHGVPACINNLGIGQHELDQPDVAEVVGHLIDKEGRAHPVHLCIANEFFAQCRELLRRQICQIERIFLIAFSLTQAPQLAAD